jgi:hypothetical protein
LWIDSLCIVQDSDQDWHRECAPMTNVYKNTYCNIAALESIDCQGGLFSGRDPAVRQPLVVKTAWKEAPGMIWSTKFQPAWIDEVLSSVPLHRRAWVLQERLFSPRTLHFAKHMIYWQCRRVTASEHSPPNKDQQYNDPVYRWPGQ